MKFENKRFAAKSKLLRFIITLFFLVNVSIIIYYEATGNGKFNLPRFIYAASILTGYLVYNVVRLSRNYYYIFLSDDYAKITVRFYKLVLLGKKFKAYEIPIKDFYKYEITENNKKKQLILYQRNGNKIGQYPPISLSALDEDEIKIVKNILNQHK